MVPLQFRGSSTQVIESSPNTSIAIGAWSAKPTANEDMRGVPVRTEGGPGVADTFGIALKTADDTYVWFRLQTVETTIVLCYFQSFDESTSPATITAVDPIAAAGALNLQSYRQARIRATVDDDPGTADVVGEVEYYDASTTTWQALLTGTFDFGDVSTTTEWEDLPVEVLAAGSYVALRVSVTGTGSESVTASVLLDLRG